MMNANQAQFGGSFQQPPPPQQQKGCWGRHWKWIVPVGCLGLILGLVAVVGGILFFAMSAMKSSEVYRGALSIARSSPAAVERLGEPIEDGWFVKGHIGFEGGSGNANFEIPLSGPKNSGTFFVWASSQGGEWTYEKLVLAVDGGEKISLLEPGAAEQPPPGATVDVEEDADDALEDKEVAAESPTPSPSGGATIEGGVLNGKAVSKPQPPYPALAKAAGAGGIVTVRVTVDETGRVVSAEGVSGHPLLQQAAVQAARNARFSPTLLSGKPVRVTGVLTYNFVAEP